MANMHLEHTREYRPDFRLTDSRLTEGREERSPTWWYTPTEEEMEGYRDCIEVNDNPALETLLREGVIYPHILQFLDVANHAPEIRLAFMEAARTIITLDSEHFPEFPRHYEEEDGKHVPVSDIKFFLLRYNITDKDEILEQIEADTFSASYQVLFFSPPDSNLLTVDTAVNDIVTMTNDFLKRSSQPLVLNPPQLPQTPAT
jgi:hypothetical protein